MSTRLEKLAAVAPGTETALLGLLLPEIEQVLPLGKTLKQVWRLADEGFEINYKTFHQLLNHCRKRTGRTAAPRGKSAAIDGVSERTVVDFMIPGPTGSSAVSP